MGNETKDETTDRQASQADPGHDAHHADPTREAEDVAEVLTDVEADEDGNPGSEEDAEQENAELFAALQRKAADLENLKKRHKKQLEEQKLYGQSKILKDFADVFSDLHLALQHASDDEGEDSGEVAKGVRLVHDKFEAVLKRYGVETYGEVGEPFDPNIHEALFRQEDPSHPRNTVIQIFQRGYKLNDRVLKPAGVVVSTGGPERDDG
jgi:molecular chaperone GrpE